MSNKIEWLIEDYPVLKNDCVGRAAVEGQLVSYPKVVRRTQDPPITNQEIGCVSFMLYQEPRKLSNGKPVYGFVNLRGNWPNTSVATIEARKLIKEVDSRYQIKLAPVGAWVPITDENAFVKELEDVKMNEEEIHLRDSAAKEKREEQRRIEREIREREEDLKSGDIYDDPSSLAYYTMKRVTENKLNEAVKAQKRTLENTKLNLKKVRTELKLLEKNNTDHLENWIDCYNMERRKAGIPDYIPSEEEFTAYQNFTPSTDDFQLFIQEQHHDKKSFYSDILKGE